MSSGNKAGALVSLPALDEDTDTDIIYIGTRKVLRPKGSSSKKAKISPTAVHCRQAGKGKAKPTQVW